MPGCADAGIAWRITALSPDPSPGGRGGRKRWGNASPPSLWEGVRGEGCGIADGLRQTLPYGFCLRPPRRTVGNPPWQIPRNATQSWSLKAGS